MPGADSSADIRSHLQLKLLNQWRGSCPGTVDGLYRWKMKSGQLPLSSAHHVPAQNQ
jgi:hypothetical protein